MTAASVGAWSGTPDRRRLVITGVLLGAAAAAWAAVVAVAVSAGEDHERVLTMGMSFPLFLATWALMMAAMMLPAASPMIDAFSRAQLSHRRAGLQVVPTVVFVAGYLLIWFSSGLVAFVLARGLEDAAMDHEWLMDAGPRFAGALIVGAGVYQLSPLKRACLGKCRTPTSFIATSWKDGYRGAIEMGLRHGAVCFGCCWLLFVILFPLGVMNVLAMAAVALLVFAEKVLPRGFVIAAIAGSALIAYGLLVLVVPDTLPSLMSGDNSTAGEDDSMQMDGM